jgi:hypothetical protein
MNSCLRCHGIESQELDDLASDKEERLSSSLAKRCAFSTAPEASLVLSDALKGSSRETFL